MIYSSGTFTPEHGLWLSLDLKISLSADRKSPLSLTRGEQIRPEVAFGIRRETPQTALRPDLDLSPRL